MRNRFCNINRQINHKKEEGPGYITGLYDCNKNYIITGNFILIKRTNEIGPVFWNNSQNCFGVFLGCWYFDKNPMNQKCYGKFIKIPEDNGMRMELEILF